MIDKIKQRLEMLGFHVGFADCTLIFYIADKLLSQIRNDTNVKEITEDLEYIIIERAAGEFIMCKKNVGSLDGFDIDNAVAQIREGDVDITYAVGSGSLTPEQRLDFLISYLMNYGKDELISRRCVKW